MSNGVERGRECKAAGSTEAGMRWCRKGKGVWGRRLSQDAYVMVQKVGGKPGRGGFACILTSVYIPSTPELRHKELFQIDDVSWANSGSPDSYLTYNILLTRKWTPYFIETQFK